MRTGIIERMEDRLEATSGKGRLFVVSGPSGVGKGSLIREMLSRYPRLELSISATTRSPREGEVDGVDYHFLKEEEFQERLDRGDFLEWAEVYGHRYGTLSGPVRRALKEGRDVVLEIDVQGARQVMRAMPEAVSIFVSPVSLGQLEERLRKRGTESEEQLKRRLEKAEWEMSEGRLFRHQVINDCLEDAIKSICEIYERESALSG